MDKEKTGQLITELRKEKGLTQKQLAEALNVTDKAVSKWERGLSFPDISMLEPIANLLDISIMELLAGEKKPEDQVLTREEAQKLVSESVELGDEELRHKKERTRLIIIILVVITLLMISLTLNVISLIR
ncbi:MAG: helix-turn-helix transcriptional regulator [Clostridiales bacterium]|nr:helix-turn-helix transcriptional regulator [Clostridiales bacterium]